MRILNDLIKIILHFLLPQYVLSL